MNTRIPCWIWALVCLVAFAATPNAHTAEVYVYLPGIPGEADSTHHTNWIEGLTCIFGTTAPNEFSPLADFSLDRVFLTKRYDAATPLLSWQCSSGELLPGMVLDIKTTVGEHPFDLRMICSNVLVEFVFKMLDTNELVEMVLFYPTFAEWIYPVAMGDPVATYADTYVNRAGLSTDDTDGDGIPDIYDPDDDGDNASDRNEFVAGTDPTDPLSFLRISGMVASQEGDVIFWNSANGRAYAMESTTNLMTAFSKLPAAILATPPQNTFTNVVPSGRVIYYRVGVEE